MKTRYLLSLRLISAPFTDRIGAGKRERSPA